MKKKKWEKFMEIVLEIFPNAIVSEDKDGELLIHTNHYMYGDDVIEFDEDSPRGK